MSDQRGSGDSPDDQPHWDFFISYTSADRTWAEWVAWQLEEAGYRVLLQAWDFVPGNNWSARMQQGVTDCDRTIALLSPAYLKSVYGQREWQVAQTSDPMGFARKLVPIRVAECDRPGLLADVVSFDLFGREEAAARALLLEQIDILLKGRGKPPRSPRYPGAAAPPPGSPRAPESRQLSRISTLEEGAISFRDRMALAFHDASLPLAFARTDHWLVGGGRNVACLWTLTDPAHPAYERISTGHKGLLSALAFAAASEIMATGATDGSVRLWAVADPTTPKLLATLNNGRNAVTALEFSPDATRLTTAGKDLSVTQWDVSDPASPQSLGVVSDKSSRCLARTAEGSLALAEGGSLRLLATPEPSEGATRHDGHILSLAAASRRNLLVSGGSDGTARLWRVENGSDLRQVSILTDHRGGVHGVALSPDDTLIATAGEDRTLRLWDIRDQGEPKRVATVPHPEGLRAVTISATGQLLAVSDVNGNVHLYWLT